MNLGRYAVMIDGGFFTKVYQSANDRKYPTCKDVVDIVADIVKTSQLDDKELLRIYYYDAPPLQIKLTNPIDKREIDLSKSELCKNARRLHSDLSMHANFSLRMGELKFSNKWGIKQSRLNKVSSQGMEAETVSVEGGDIPSEPQSIPVYARDLQPEINQKGVDLRIGMDIACMALRQLVDTVVIITGDSDILPAMKLARREGVRVYIVAFKERKLTDDLIIHSDHKVEVSITREERNQLNLDCQKGD